MGSTTLSPAIIENTATTKFSRPIRLLDSFTQNFSIMISIKISIMIETYWINFGYWQLLEFFPKCPLKSRLSYVKFKTILPSICRHGNVNSKVTYVHYTYIHIIFNSFFTSDNNLSDISWLIVSLFVKQSIIQLIHIVFHNKELKLLLISL